MSRLEPGFAALVNMGLRAARAASRRWRLFGSGVVLLAGCAMSLPHHTAAPVPSTSTQLLLVRSMDWTSTAAMLQRYEREPGQRQWHRVGAAIPVVLGRSGMAWGIGLHDIPASAAGPEKREGDGASPAGVFELHTSFGYAPRPGHSRNELSHIVADDALECVDDSDSRHYNRLVSAAVEKKDWTSSELMYRNDDLYRLGVVIEHNWGERRQAGRGSCIFLHIWRSENDATDGCTAMPSADVDELVRWLDRTRHPVIVQLPQIAYERLRGSWSLP